MPESRSSTGLHPSCYASSAHRRNPPALQFPRSQEKRNHPLGTPRCPCQLLQTEEAIALTHLLTAAIPLTDVTKLLKSYADIASGSLLLW